MITVTDKQLCCGCGACVQKCPKHCISLQADNEGFAYPVVDAKKCIDCGLCEKVCPELHPYSPQEPLKVFAAFATDDDIRFRSSSGGIFSLIAENVIAEGGVVFGARFDREWQVVIDWTETKDGLEAFRGAKYVQARTGESFRKAEEFLRSGRKVLYSGTHCQIAGLQHYLGKNYSNLLTVDCLCHGVPSPKVWGMYLDEVTDAQRRAISDIRFRDKSDGWRLYNFRLDYAGKTEMACHRDNPFMQAFLKNLILRPSCHNCRAKQGRSHSDISLADFWGIQVLHPDMYDDRGASLVTVNTDKGVQALDSQHIKCVETSFSDALPYNSGFESVQPEHRHRSRFFSRLDKCGSVTALILKEVKPSLKEKIVLLPYKTKLAFYRLFPKARSIRR